MNEGIIFAGFGGQGVILAGKLLCIASMLEGKYVSHIPSYGAEMRGGTANCSVMISDEMIASPIVYKPSICVILNQPSLEKFEPRIQEGGILIYNSSLIDIEPVRNDIIKVPIRATDIAAKVGTARIANMVAIGHLVKLKPELATIDSVIKALDKAVSARNKELNIINEKALRAGYEID